MKKTVKQGLLLLLFCLATLAACGKKEDAAPSSATDPDRANIAQEQTTADPGSAEEDLPELLPAQEYKAYDTDIVSEMYAEEGTVRVYYGEGDEDYYEDEYAYHVPQIDEDTEGAREINALIHQEFDEVFETLEKVKNREPGYENAWIEISYDAYWNDNYLSLVIRAQSTFEDYIGYHIYNYDAATGMRVSNEELLAMHRISEEDFITLARITAVKEFDETMAEYLKYSTFEETDGGYSAGEFYSEFMGFRLSTITDNSLDVSMPLYLDGDGELSVIVCVSVPAGGGSYLSCQKLARDTSEWERLQKCDIPEEMYYPGFNKSLLRLYGDEGYETARRTSPGNSDGTFYLGFDSNDPGIFVRHYYYTGVLHSSSYSGNLKLVGMSENGYLFEYRIANTSDAADSLMGRFYLNPDWRYNEETDLFEETVVYRWADGDDLLDAGDETLELVKSFG